MAGTMLFCIAEDAKTFTKNVLDVETDKVPPGYFWLVESRAGPPEGEKFRKRLNASDSFDTDFIGATEQDCQKWARERQQHDNMVDQNKIVIVDSRSVKDETVLLQKFNERPDGAEDFTFGDYGALPAERNIWYSFRVPYKDVCSISAALTNVAPDVAYPIYYGSKEHFTDEHGVFNVKEADRYCMNEDQDVKDSDIIKRKYM